MKKGERLLIWYQKSVDNYTLYQPLLYDCGPKSLSRSFLFSGIQKRTLSLVWPHRRRPNCYTIYLIIKNNYQTRTLRRSLDSAFTARLSSHYIMPPIPPMPPISGIAGAAEASTGASATIASVVIIKLAIDDANCNALRVTLVGSRIPISNMSP